ncbi:unnamed protein product [Ophioblennius macclurei]
MKCLLVLHACVLLLWTWTEFVSCSSEPTVKGIHDKIELSCPDGYEFSVHGKTLQLDYKDENSGEYTCNTTDKSKIFIFVKLRTCDNCIELDLGSAVGMAIGNVVATCLIGVAVYLFASVIQKGPDTSNNKKSDRQPPRRPEPRGASNDPYQSLAFRSPRDEYDKLNRKN